MKSLLAAFLFSLLVWPSAAQSAWSPFVPLGNGTLATSNPSCAFVAPNEAVCAVSNASHRIAVNRLVNGSWKGWKVLDGTITSDPSCIRRKLNAREVLCVARGVAAKLVYTIYDGRSWSVPALIAAPAFSAPSCARLTDTKSLCVVRNEAGGWSSAILTGTNWSAFTTLSEATVFDPDCDSDAGGQVICAALNPQGQVIVNRFNGAVWEGFLNIGGTGTDQPACARPSGFAGNMACLVRGTNLGGFANFFNGGAWTPAQWSGFGPLAGLLQSHLSCDGTSDIRLVCGAIGVDNSLYFNTFNGSTWAGWQAIGGMAIGSPACINISAPANMLCVVRRLDNRLARTIGTLVGSSP